MRTRFLALSTLFAVLPTAASAQTLTAGSHTNPMQLSPRDTVRATVGTAKVLIDYGRPSKRNRVIFGELIPYGKVWRTGANAATTFVTDKDLTIGGVAVPAGTYTLYTLPADSTTWHLIINKQTKQWGTQYDQSQDLARIPLKVTKITTPVEKFEITVPNGGMLHLRWDTTDAAVPIAVK